MDAAWADQDDIALPQGDDLIITLYGIDVFCWHDDFRVRVPVRRIVFVFIIIIKLDRGALLIKGFQKYRLKVLS